MAIRLSCADFAFPRLDFAQSCHLITWLGLDFVDVGILKEYAHFTPTEMTGDAGGVADVILAGTQAAGIGVAHIFANVHHPDFHELAVNHSDPAVRADSIAVFKTAIDLAVRVGASGISDLPGIVFDELGPAGSFDLAVRELTHRAELAGERGLHFAVEPHVGSLLQDPRVALDFCAAAPTVPLLLDYSHYILQGYSQDAVDPLLPHAGHLHLRQAARGVLQIVGRLGEIDFDSIYDGLERSGFDGYACIEHVNFPWQDCDRVDCITETAAIVDGFKAWSAGRQGS